MSKFSMDIKGVIVPKRIDSFLAAHFIGKFSREEIKKSLEKGMISLNGKPTKPRILVKDGDLIEGEIAEAKGPQLEPENIPLDIVYEDDWLLVVNKIAGMVVHPGAGNKRGTLVHALLGRGVDLSNESGDQRPGIVHRLDKETSGLLVVAKTNESHRRLQAQFASRTLSRTYEALVQGRVEFDEGRIELALGRHPSILGKMAVSKKEDAKDAETHYKVIKRFKLHTLLRLKLLTGRTHQIRVHMAHLGYPVMGDMMYGNKSQFRRHALHARKIEFAHPKNDKIVSFEAPVPEDMLEMIRYAESL